MLGMQAAVERIERAVAAHEPILIYGDYDVDGTTATVLLKTAIEMLGGTARFHIPHRLREGYGMQREILETAAQEGVRLVISVDTGIRAFAAADAAAELGLDLIVTDHHLPETAIGIPRALAVLNPNQRDAATPAAICAERASHSSCRRRCWSDGIANARAPKSCPHSSSCSPSRPSPTPCRCSARIASS